MTKRRRTTRLARSRHAAHGVGFALMLAALGAAAQRGPDSFVAPGERPDAVIAQRANVTLEQATAMAQRQHQGRVVRAEPVTRDGRLIYEIRILGDDGRVRTVRIDAETGRML